MEEVKVAFLMRWAVLKTRKVGNLFVYRSEKRDRKVSQAVSEIFSIRQQRILKVLIKSFHKFSTLLLSL